VTRFYYVRMYSTNFSINIYIQITKRKINNSSLLVRSLRAFPDICSNYLLTFSQTQCTIYKLSSILRECNNRCMYPNKCRDTRNKFVYTHTHTHIILSQPLRIKNIHRRWNYDIHSGCHQPKFKVITRKLPY